MKILFAVLSLLGPLATARSEPLLTAELVPATNPVVAGHPFTVAVKLTHIEHGHSYWVNPGGPGTPTKFQWTLPEGFTAGDPQWPVPAKALAAGFVAYLFEGEAVALVAITPPATLKAGDTVPLALQVKALVCIEDCTPVTTTAKATVRVADQAGAPNALIEQTRRKLPVAPRNWTLAAEKSGGGFAIALTPLPGANPKLTTAYFFSDAYPDQVIDSQKPQALKKDGNRWVLTLPPTEEAPPTAALTGLLVAEEGWVDGDATVKAFAVNLPLGAATPAAGGGPEKRSVATMLLFAFIGGLILNIMPCVFPVLGIKIMGFVQQAGEDRRKIFLHGLAYTLGVLVCFWALALFVISVGKGWGAQLQSPLFVLALCYFFMAFGLNMAGVFEIGGSAIGVGQGLQEKSGLQGSFFSGLLATVVATPCSAPFLGPALAYALSLPSAMALGVFTVIGLGLSSPYLIFSLAPGLVHLLPRPGAWMESFKQGMSFLLFGTVGYLLWTLGGMVDEWHLLMVIFGLVLVALACWIYGRWCLPHKKAMVRRLGLGAAGLALGSGVLLGWPGAKSPGDLEWKPWSPELVKELRATNTPVYIDFTARWCATCQVNKRVYHDAALKKLIRTKGIVLLKADWTNYDERITTVLRDEYHKAAVPVNVFYPPGAKEAVILSEILTVDRVAAVLGAPEALAAR